MKINELIQAVTKEYMPIKKKFMSNSEVTEEDTQKYFELNTTLELYKILKGAFMEEITKNKEVFPVMLAEKLITTRQEDAEKDGKIIKVTVVNESMDYQIDNLPEQFQKAVLEKMVKAHKENLNNYNKPGYEDALRKEAFELQIIEQFLPKEATKEDIMEYLNEYYPSGVEQKSMGKVIGEVKKAFERADGKLIAECVKSKLA